ncbi:MULTISPECIES: hypothetical protein [Paraburkholderia]|uniref:hypothetical protein n=1 Tax=Paraburkholderia TaxID=1822464 RepID=UPI00159340C5|nr:hypothetical protein [Paraburkholderia youngii]
MSYELGARIVGHQYECIKLYAVGPAFGARPQRSAQREPTCAVKQLRSAHSGPARGDELGYRRRERFRCAIGGQRQSHEFEAIGHAKRRSPDHIILAETVLRDNGLAALFIKQ